MGTRNLTVVRYKNKYRIAQYGQFDGYPAGQGMTVLTFLKKANLDKFKNNLEKVVFVKNNDTAYENKLNEAIDLYNYIEEEVRKLEPELDYKQRKRKIFKHLSPELKFLYLISTRNTGADILNVIASAPEKIKKIKLYNLIDFAYNSLFCRWAYVIDLDKNSFEIYKGSVTEPLDPTERFYRKRKPKPEYEDDTIYYPVKLLKSYSLDKLPTKKEFLSLDE